MPFTFETHYLDWPLVPGRAWDLFWPRKIELPVAVLFIHGGGWHSGGRANEHRIMAHLTDAGIVTASADYRLTTTGATLAEQLADVREACASLRLRLRERGGPARVVVYGGSAGAHLALLLTMAKPGACGDAPPRDNALFEMIHEPAAGVAVQSAPVTFEPWSGIESEIWTSMNRVIGQSYEDRPDLYQRASPIQYVHPGCPPIFLMDASEECTFPLELNGRFAESLRAVGARVAHKVYHGAEHGFFYDLTRGVQREAMADLLTFIRSCA